MQQYVQEQPDAAAGSSGPLHSTSTALEPSEVTAKYDGLRWQEPDDDHTGNGTTESILVESVAAKITNTNANLQATLS